MPPPPRPLPMCDRSWILFIENGQLDVLDGAFVVLDQGFEFVACGKDRVVSVDLDGLRLVAFGPRAYLPRDLPPPEAVRRHGR